MPFWHRLIVVGVVMFVTIVVARLIDRRIARRDLPPEAITRYRIVRRSVTTTIIFVGLLTALLVIPQVRAVAGGLLASSAVIGIVVGFASQRTLGNFVAGGASAGDRAGRCPAATAVRAGAASCVDALRAEHLIGAQPELTLALLG